MQLISLTADHESFRPIHFNKTGPSFIVAKQKNGTKNMSNTYNGVGKSLAVALIDYCLGASSALIVKELEDKLPDWTFSLVVLIEKKTYTIQRNTTTPKNIKLNDDEITIQTFKKRLEKLCFTIPPKVGQLTFRALIPFFLRPNKASYVRYDVPFDGRGGPYIILIRNAFLMGLNVHQIKEKKDLTDSLKDLDKRLKNVADDPDLKDFFLEDTTMDLDELNDRLEDLKFNLKETQVAEDFYEKKQQADDAKRQLDRLSNEVTLKRAISERIEANKKIKPDVTKEHIEKIYREAQLIFQTEINKDLEDIELFYSELKDGRLKRLNAQQQTIETQIIELKQKKKTLQSELDNCLKYLNAHHAIDVFLSLKDEIADLELKKNKLEGYSNLKSRYSSQINKTKENLVISHRKANKYLENLSKTDFHEFKQCFRGLVKKCYPNAKAGITITNNEGENTLRYTMEAKIESDTSDGISSVKIFCYDNSILHAGKNHNINFIFHDSRLFDPVDETHREGLFLLIRELFPKESDKQYIASVNQHHYSNLSEEVQSFIQEHTVLELTDDSDKEKLLGIKVELEYDKT